MDGGFKLSDTLLILLAELVLNPSKKEKIELFQRARALLYPIESHEPFGLIVIEAMSCGTPVVAMNLGAMPEIIKDGYTGFLCNSLKDFEKCLNNLGQIDPKNCHFYVREKFDYRKVVPLFVEVYRRLQGDFDESGPNLSR